MALMEDYSKGKRSIGGKKVRSIKVPIYNPSAAEDALRGPLATPRRRASASHRVRTAIGPRQRRAVQHIDEAHRSFMGRNPHINLGIQTGVVSEMSPGRRASTRGRTIEHAAKYIINKAAKKSKFGRITSAVGSLLK
jgi:hypothetical protein